jgi:parallel beta-helix repeat protein
VIRPRRATGAGAPGGEVDDGAGIRTTLAGNVAARVLALASIGVATVVVARAGGPAAVGTYALLRVVSGLTGVVASAGLPGAVTYFLAGPSGADRRLRPTIVAMALAGGALGTAAWAAVAPALRERLLPDLSPALALWAGATVFTQLLVATAKACSQGTDDLPGSNRTIVYEELLFLPAYALLWLGGIRGYPAMVAALLAADLGTVVLAGRRLAVRGFFRGWAGPSMELARRLGGYGVRAQVGGVLLLLNLRLDFAVLGLLTGPSVVGVYAIASKFAELLRLVSLALTYVLYPSYARAGPAAAARRARALAPRAAAVTLAAALPLAAVAGLLLPALYGPAFAAAVTPTRILLLGLAPEGAAAVATAFLYGVGRPGLNSMAMGAGVAVTVALDLALIPSLGASGAAWASTAAYLTSTAMLLVWFRRTADPRPARPRRRLAWRLPAVLAISVTLAAAGWSTVPARAGGRAWGAATTLYVDRADPACSDTGPGSQDQPFCAIRPAASAAVAGQTVSVAAGTYQEMVSPSHSGTPDAPIAFVAAGPGVTVTGGVHGFSVSGRSWIEIRGFDVTATSDAGIYLSGSSNVTVEGDHVSYSGQPSSGLTSQGVYVTSTTGSVIADNTVDHNTDSGIYLKNGSTGNDVRANVVFANASQYSRIAPGIDVRSGPNTVEANVSYGNEDSGIQVYAGAADNLLFDNVTYANGDHGIDVNASPGQRIVSNTVYDNVTAGINVEGGSTGASLANNVSVDNGIDSPRTSGNLRVDSQSAPGTTLDYDLVWLRTSGTMASWGSSGYLSLAAFRTASGTEAAGLQADPRWVSAATGDFHLSPGSPAVDSANSGAAGQPAFDVTGAARYDDPATPNTGAGPRAYDDRGAPGTFTVVVTVTDQAGLTGVASAQVSVTPGGGNLVGNPGFEAGTSGWSTAGSGPGVTLARVAGGHTGGWAARLANAGPATGCGLNDAPNWVGTTAAGTYTATGWFRADASGARLKFRLRELSGSTLVGSRSSSVVLGTGWKRVAVAYTAASPGSTLDLNALVAAAPAGTCFYADDLSVVAS